jgi:serine/threonine protein phosphatase PrpC
MSTYRFIPAKRKGRKRSSLLLSMLGGLLITFPLLFAPPALAASRGAPATLNQQGIVDLAGVSVVRLSVEYLPSKGTPSVFCTLLGTIIASWPAQNASDKNTWVLTDGSLLFASPKNTCAPGEKLAAIHIFASNEFTNDQAASAQLGQLGCTGTGVCSDVSNAINSGPQEAILPAVGGATLFSFHSASPLPFVDVETGSTDGTLAPTSIELVNTKGVFPPSIKNGDPTTSQEFLTPKMNSATSGPGNAPTATTAASTQSNEPGMPFIDGNGKITGAQLFNTTSLVTMADILTLEKQAPFPQGSALSQNLNNNTLSKQWDLGITQYEQGNYRGAIQTLGSIQNAPAAFQAPVLFVKKAQAHLLTGNNGTPTATSTATGGQGGSFLGISTGVLLIVGLVAGMLVLLLLFLLVNLLFGRKRLERKRELDNFEADVARARQNVEKNGKPQSKQYALPPQPQTYAGAGNYPAAPVSESRCPNCGQPVDERATYCSNCRYVFTPADAETLRYPPPSMPPLTTTPLAVPAPAQPQSASISDMPTTEMSNRNGGISPEAERTMPYSVQQLQGRNLGLAVITDTNPGIKRKHKPNEDSLFAMQGARTHNSEPQQFGLFVVADGMGGHANGQDASRLAIQTIIDFMLPRISTGNGLNDEGYKNLLMEGVQQANLAVHQRNLQDHADMGTTMTAALVVGSTAYIANVGDSRTYLYREPYGLRQITHDHSVVASLVDAGIIKPDDIYTHPKRNQIYRSLGEKPGVEIDSFIQPLQANDKLLLCSDGLWDMVRDPDIQRVISGSMPSPNQIGKNLIQAALDGGGEDNVSVIVVSITEEAGHTGMTGIHLHAKPDSVTVPELPNM